MPRYVILEHDHPGLHWDFMLETGGVLLTWRLAAPPEPEILIPALALADHRLQYLDYEGPVSGNRGLVKRWDAGTFSWLEQEAERIVVRLTGQKLAGTACLQQQGEEKWSLSFTTESQRTQSSTV